MNEFKHAKEEYDQIPIPEELGQRVQTGIGQGRKARRRAETLGRARRFSLSFAACFAVLLAGLNLSPGFAAAAAEVPVVGGLLKVLTVRSYQATEEDVRMDIQQPALRDESPLAVQVNEEIAARVAEKEAQGRRIVQEYKDAFLATGGTEAEWASRPAPEVRVRYEMKSQSERAVSFLVESYVSVASAYQEQVFYNLDLAAGRELTLADVLGENWVERSNESIRAQMDKAEDPTVFFAPEDGGFATVDETTAFYLNEAGNAVVVFPKYTVAPGYLGTVEFELVTEQP